MIKPWLSEVVRSRWPDISLFLFLWTSNSSWTIKMLKNWWTQLKCSILISHVVNNAYLLLLRKIVVSLRKRKHFSDFVAIVKIICSHWLSRLFVKVWTAVTEKTHLWMFFSQVVLFRVKVCASFSLLFYCMCCYYFYLAQVKLKFYQSWQLGTPRVREQNKYG